MPRLAAILLAAGGSSRMGRPKQLLRYDGQSLLRRAASVALAAGCDPVAVVLGSRAEEMMPELEGLTLTTTFNEHWPRGIGTSIRHGVSRLPIDVTRSYLLLADQPLITPDVLRHLAGSTKPVAACQYADTLGPPVLVSRELFPNLLALPDDRGAKHLWISRPEIVEAMPFPDGSIDIDTPEDYARLTPPAARASPTTPASLPPGSP
jgi:molybdenum cofactor cytidylyltransferase